MTTLSIFRSGCGRHVGSAGGTERIRKAGIFTESGRFLGEGNAAKSG